MRKNRNLIKSILFMFFVIAVALHHAHAQSRQVKGKVTAEGAPLAGVSVQIQGTQQGTATNEQGQFSITVTATDALIITAMGYQRQTINLADQTAGANGEFTLNVEMLTSGGDALEEVVVVGFGTQKKTNLTGSVAIVDAKQLENRPVQSAVQAL
ncbi:carboxypeptidase-like regulatory domain-containing protein, partial [Brucella sp. 21LCYQ03]|nr:carboxypeptidase-like regulatory domain-containing protein [Brucella sp. 21LCYQ03]